jgi:hypothetical protein
MRRLYLSAFCLLMHWPIPGPAKPALLLDENFATLKAWASKPATYPKLKPLSRYEAVTENGHPLLKTASNASASSLEWAKAFNPNQYPILSWRWKVDQIYAKGDGRKAEGDDYPLRITVSFTYEPTHMGRFWQIKYEAAKAYLGEYPPHAALAWVWSSKPQKAAFYPSPFSERMVVFPIGQGSVGLGQWHNVKVDIVRDYQSVFKTAPPNEAKLSIMNDSDDTQEAALSWVEWVKLGPP